MKQKAKPKRQVIRTGDIIVQAAEVEMEAVQCHTCGRPFWVTASLATMVRKDGNTNIYCPIGHITRPDRLTEVQR